MLRASDFMTIVGYPVTLFNRLIQWWGQIRIGDFTVWQWILSFMLVGIGIALFRLLIGSIPSVGVASELGRANREQEYANRRSERRSSKNR